ncbi:hypothetical protein [Profundibacter amoris]|uniref:hypothetical protein n=1 Tax=Profundibacter amoris TaxID=2171755 RepID=UPI0013C362AE|nr:hypothetical protein [Profundibacter amoris]
MIPFFKRSVLISIIGIMLLMGQTGAFAALRNHLKGEQLAGNSTSVIAKRVLYAKNPTLPVAVITGTAICCICNGAGPAKTADPSTRFSKIPRAAGFTLYELTELQPPHDPPRI